MFTLVLHVVMFFIPLCLFDCNFVDSMSHPWKPYVAFPPKPFQFFFILDIFVEDPLSGFALLLYLDESIKTL